MVFNITRNRKVNKNCWISHKQKIKMNLFILDFSHTITNGEAVKHSHTHCKVLTSSDLYELRMQRPLAHVNSLAEHDLRVQFWCSSSASVQSASPSHTQSRGIHFLWGGLLLTQVNSWGEHERLAARSGRNRREGNVKKTRTFGCKGYMLKCFL